jgi:hypothetical protein
MNTITVTKDDVIDFSITYHEDLDYNPDQIDLTWMLYDLSQYTYHVNETVRFESICYILINQ